MLEPADSKIARALLGGHAPSIAKAVLGQEKLRDAVIVLLLMELNGECTNLCRSSSASPFHKIPVDKLVDFKWTDMVTNLQLNAPLLFTLLYSIASRNDNRNTVKVGAAHYAGVCSAVAVLLKERNREMCGLQSLVSLLMYSCHAEKQVKKFCTMMHRIGGGVFAAPPFQHSS